MIIIRNCMDSTYIIIIIILIIIIIIITEKDEIIYTLHLLTANNL